MRSGQLVTCALHRNRWDVIGEREDQERAEDALERAEADLFKGHGRDRQRAHDAVIDLAGDAELLRQGQSDCGDAGEHDGDGHQAGSRTVPKFTPPAAAMGLPTPSAHVREDVREDKEEEQRLHDDAQGEWPKLTTQHTEIAHEQAGEGDQRVLAATRGRRLWRSDWTTHAGPSRKADEDGFKAGFAHRDVADAVRLRGFEQSRQQAFDGLGEDA